MAEGGGVEVRVGVAVRVRVEVAVGGEVGVVVRVAGAVPRPVPFWSGALLASPVGVAEAAGGTTVVGGLLVEVAVGCTGGDLPVEVAVGSATTNLPVGVALG